MTCRPLIPVDANDLLLVVSALYQLSIDGEMSAEHKSNLFRLENRLERILKPQGFPNAQMV